MQPHEHKFCFDREHTLQAYWSDMEKKTEVSVIPDSMATDA